MGIYSEDMIYLRHKGLPLLPSGAASKEMARLGLTQFECRAMLEAGYPAPRRRAANTEEVWFDCGRKTYNVVIVKTFHESTQEEIYLITHIGRFTRK